MKKIVKACKVQNVLRWLFDLGMSIVCLLTPVCFFVGDKYSLIVVSLICIVGFATIIEGITAIIHYYLIRKKICNCLRNMAYCQLKDMTGVRVRFRNVERYYLSTPGYENYEWMYSCINTLKTSVESSLGQKVRFYYNDLPVGD